MIYIFDKKQAIIKVLTNDDFTAAHLNFKINTATTFEFSLPASKALPSGSKYVATPHPLNDSKFIMLRLTERVDNTETIDYSAYELAYQELATDGYIEDKRPQNQSALNLMKIALDGSNWELNNVNVSGTATTNFYYVDRLSAISKVVDLLGGEIVFYIEIQGNAISGRYMDYLARQGADTSKVFASGSNLLTVERQSDTSGIYTAILPRGKGKEIDNGEADTPDGYGRRINIADVEWKKSAGKPLDKPKGSIVLSDPDATAEWGQINGNARLLLQTYDDIDDVNVLINSAYKTLQSVNHPQIQYSATVADVGGLSLGDTVLIMHGDRDLSYKTRVFEVKYDLLSPDQTELSLGDNLSSNSITSQINSLNAVADTTSSQTQWTINQIGRPSTTFGNTEPANPKVGDVFFKELPDGVTEIYRWNGDIWELLASPTTADDIATAVDDAVTQAKAHVDEVKQGLSSDIATARSEAVSQANAAASEAYAYTDKVKKGLSGDIETAKSQATSQASTAEANAKSEATSQFNQAKDALAEAKENLQSDIDESKGNIVEINQTLTGFDGTLQRVQDAVNSLGQTNQLMNTEFTPDLANWSADAGYELSSGLPTYDGSNVVHIKTTNTGYDYLRQSIPVVPGQVISFSTMMKFAPTSPDGSTVYWRYSINFYKASGGSNLAITYGKQNFQALEWTLQKSENIVAPADAAYVTINYYMRGASESWLAKPMLVFESTVGTYVQGNYNNNEALAKVKLTADQASLDLSTYQIDADGRIKKAQSGIEANATAITTKVSQTDYDKKTGELSNKLNTTTDTADGTKQSLSDYKEYANGNISVISSDLSKLAGKVDLKLTKTDYDNDQSILNTSLSQWKADYDGWTGTVSKLSDKVNNLGQTNQLTNTEFNPDTEGWTLYADKGSKAPYQSFVSYGSRGIGFNTVNADASTFAKLSQTILLPNTRRSIDVMSLTWRVNTRRMDNYCHIWLIWQDANGVSLGQSTMGNWNDSTLNNYNVLKWENISIPVDAKQVDIRFETREGTNAYIFQPMVSFTDTIGTYVQGNYNNNAALAQVKITADGINNFVRDSSGNISSEFQTSLSRTSIITGSTLASSIETQTATQISSALRDNNGKIISLINQDSSGVQIAGENIILDGNTTFTALKKTVNSMGQVNQLFNTEFSPDLEGWSTSETNSGSRAPYRSYFQDNINATVVGFNTTSSSDSTYARFQQTVQLSSTPGSGNAISISWYSYTIQTDNYNNVWVRFYDNSNTKLLESNQSWADLKGNNPSGNNSWTVQNKWENITVPDTATYLIVSFEAREGTIAYLGHPMLVFGSTVGAYAAGSYNNNAALAQVKNTADSLSSFVRDSNGNISANFQTALSKTSIITGSTLATSIKKETATQISSALTDNNGKIISLINQDTSGVQIAGENITLDGNTTVTGDFYAKGGNFKNLNASNFTVGTLNGNQVNITNLNASNIVTGSISGANLDINLNTGQVVFQRGRIYNDDINYKGIDINIDQSYISTKDYLGYSTLANGGLYLSQTRLNDPGYKPYFSIDNNNTPFGTSGALLLGTNGVAIATDGNSMPTVIGGEIYNGLLVTKGKQTVVAGARNGVMISGGKEFDNTNPFINVGATNMIAGTGGNRIQAYANYFHLPLQWSKTTSNGANMYIASDGAIVRSSSSSKYKLDIEYEQQAETANRLLTLDPATWHDKFESKQLDKFHEIGVDPERTIDMSNRRYYGIIAEDLVKAGLEHLVSRNVETGEVEGVEYSKIGVALIPIIRDLRNRLNDQNVEIERLKGKIK